jgi:ATP-binding cassette subfamily B protein
VAHQDPRRPVEPDGTKAADQTPGAASGPLGFIIQIAPYLRPYWLRCSAIGALTLFQVSLYLLIPVVMRLIFDLAIEAPDPSRLWRVLGAIAVGYVALGVAELLQSFLSAALGAKVMNDLRLRLFHHLQALPYGFYTHTPYGMISTRFTTDLATADLALTTSVYKLCFHATLILASVVFLFVFEWRLALVALVTMPLGIIGPRIFGPHATHAGYTRQETEADAVSTVEEAIRAQSTIRAFGLQAFSGEAFKQKLRRLYRTSLRTHVFGAYVEKVSALGILLFQLVVIGAGAFFVLHGYLTGGTLLGFMAILVNIGNSARTLTTFVPSLVQASSGMRRIVRLLDEPPEADRVASDAPLPTLSGQIRFDQVSFSYTGAERHLDRISFTVKAGQTVALVGSSGSGKSTVLNLLMRFYEAWEGDIWIDGLDIRSLPREALRSQIGPVFQDTFLFNTTIRENIRVGRLQATDAEVEASARAAELHEFIVGLPQGYETEVGEGGGRLSGGQRQRIAVARALLRNPSILLLDEATSALDPMTEAAVQQTLRQVGQGRTVISVTHRLATAVHADDILVLDRGLLVEQGTHQTLLSQNGIYASLWQRQSGVNRSEDDERAEVQVDRLRSLPVLQALDPPLLEELVPLFVTERYARNQIVIRQGESGDRFFLIVRGRVAVVQTEHGQPERHIDVLEEGDYFGEIALLRSAPRSATIRTLTPCTFLSLRREHLLHLVSRSLPLRRSLEQSLKARIGAS